MSTDQTFAAALRHHQGGRLNEAETLYRRILQADSTHADALHMLGVLCYQTGRQQLAVDMLRRAIAQNGQMPAFHNNLGTVYTAAGNWPDAESCFRRALECKPDYGEAHYNLGTALEAQNRLEDAASAYRHALRLRPHHAGTWLNLSNVLRAQGKLEQAAVACQHAISVKPELAAAHNNLGNILAAQGRSEAAVAAYSKALTLRPNLAEAHHNRGLALLSGGRVDEAVVSCRQAVAHNPNFVAAHVTLGHALTQSGESGEALQCYQRALALDPNCGEAMLGCAVAPIPIVCGSILESNSAAATFNEHLHRLIQWTDAHPGKLGEAVGAAQPFYLAYRPSDLTAIVSRYGNLASSEASAYWKPPPVVERASAPGRNRIRIAIVSGHVRQRHPVWEIILRGLIGQLDPQQFEVYLYHTGAAVDAETDWARSQVARFVQGPQPLKLWVAQIVEAQPDAIFYPELGMDPNSRTLAALRLAPLQIAGWGHPITTGLPSIDWFVSAELLESAQAQEHYREKLIRLPGTGVYTESRPQQSEHWGGPERRAGVVRFALCQQPLKFDPGDDQLLACVAKSAGNAEFWLATPDNMPWTAMKLRDRLSAAFRAEGLDPQARLHVTGWLPRARFISFLHEMDIYLDCPAFSGYTTAWQALHCGLPIVTLEGPYLRQRLAAGLLRQIEATEGIAQSREEYLATALRWANECREGERWEARRAGVRRAAARADENRSAILAFEQKLREAFHTAAQC
jgi:predicted O-linked N-acetylglucosamine transferase (SPINDLY family)